MKQPLAYIHPDAKIAPSVVIDPFVTIDRNVEIGEGTRIASNVTIMEGSRIGRNCTIFPGAVIGAVPQDLKFKGEDTLVAVPFTRAGLKNLCCPEMSRKSMVVLINVRHLQNSSLKIVKRR